MSALTMHQLGQLRHLDLLALCYQVRAVTPGTCDEFLARRPKEALIDLLSRPWAQGRTPVAGLSPDCGNGCHAPLCDGRNCSCECHR